MKRIYIPFAVTLLMVLSACDANYDFNNVNPDAVFMKNTDIPVDGQDSMALSELLKDQSKDSYLKADSEGNYYLSVDSKKQSASVTINCPSLVSKLNGRNISFTVVPVPDKSILPESWTFGVDFSSIGNQVNISEKVDSNITDIKYLYGSGTFNFRLKIPTNKAFSAITLKSGAKLLLPQWLDYTMSQKTAMNFEYVAGTGLVLKNDVEIKENETFEISVDITRVDMQKLNSASYFERGRIELHDTISLYGSSFITKSQVKTHINSIDIDIAVEGELNNFVSKSAEVKADPDLSSIKINPVIIDTTKVPGFLKAKSSYLDIESQLEIDLYVINNFPCPVYIGTKLSSVFNNTEPSKVTMTIDPCEFKGQEASHNVIKKNTKDTDSKTSFLYVIPNRIEAGDYYARIAQEWINLEFRKQYTVDFIAGFKIPLSFGSKAYINYNDAYSEVNIDLGNESKLYDATMNLTMVNCLPFNVELTPRVVDKQKKVVEEIVCKDVIKLPKGSVMSPSVTEAKFTLLSEKGFSKIEGINLLMNMNDANPSNCLNMGMFVSFNDLCLKTENGIIISK